MKKTILALLVCAMLLTLLAACGGSKLDGLYEQDAGGGDTRAYLFSGKNASYLWNGGIMYTYTYSISGDTITFSDDTGETSRYFNKSGNTITIGDNVYLKK